MNCPRCDSENLKKDGKRDSKQRYFCKDCGKYFTETSINKPKIPKELIIRDVLMGGNVPKLCVKYSCTSKLISRIMAPHYAVETITSAQRRDIIKYGYYLKVPVDYMAEYIKCSEHKCREVLKDYKEKLMSTTRGATA